jgi:hypothetical protein
MTSDELARDRAVTGDAAPPDPGNAPAPGDAVPRAVRTPPVTSRPLWFLTYLAVLVFMALRLPRTYDYLSRNMPPAMSAEINDKDLEALALRIGLFLGLVLTALIFGMLFVASAILEKRMFPARKALGRRLTFGLYFLVVATCVLPPQVVSVLFDIAVIKGVGLYVYVAAVGLLAPVVFHRAWRPLPPARVAAIFAVSLGLAAFTSIG